ncbi:MAG: hypothetical protein WD824_09090 [Cyclobacteriaceae bacterium]
MKKILSVFILYILFAFAAFAQENPLDTLIKKFGQYREVALQEKIYAHLDRSFYLTGETLWFKIYMVDGGFHKPIDVSKVAYAEILDRAGFPVLQAKIEMKNGTGNGSFFLPASLSSGNYRFRLYTSWMKNFNPEFYFDELFTIVNPFVLPEPAQTNVPTSCNVDFFPEGGNLVSGIQSKVAFKISDASGKGSDSCHGFLLNDQGDTITSFKPGKFGMGYFLFTPSDNETYKAALGEAGGQKIYPFPEVHKAGYVMQLEDAGESLNISVTSMGVEGAATFLFVHARQEIVQAEKQMLRDNRAIFRLNKKDLPDGISHITLFNDALQPVCERLYFTYPDKVLDIDISSSQKIYNPRKKVSVSIQTKINTATPVVANLSLSVYKIDSLSSINPVGINPYLWLAADLTGRVEFPEYYFDNAEPGAVTAMDNLMLTQGWRRFDWKDILDKPPVFSFLPEVNDHIIMGIVTRDEEKTRGIFTYLGSPGKIIRAYGSWSNERGEVRFEIKDFYGPRKIIIQTQTDSSQTYNVQVQNPFSTSLLNEKITPFRLSEKMGKAVLSRSIAMQVQDIYYYEQYGNRFEQPVVDSSAFYGKADATYFLDDYTRFQVMEEVMREYVPGVFVRKRKDGFHFIVVDYVNGGVLYGDPMVLLDGVPILDVDDIMRMDPLRVKKLEVVKRQYYLGQSVFSGIVSYSTYGGDLGGLELDPRAVTLNYDGLQLKREFYSPQYASQSVNDRLPDQRYLLHWEPDITTDADGKHVVEFFTSAVPGQYMVAVEGLNKDGFSGSKKYTFTVKAPDNQ